MKIVTVVPLARGIPTENLTYFTAKEIEIGSVVEVPLRKKMIDAIVVGAEDLSEAKGLVKASDFKLRKVGEVKGSPILPEGFWRAIEKTKRYFASTTGAAIYSLLPKVFFENYAQLAKPPEETTKIESNLKQEKLALGLPLEDRLTYYKTIIREAFAKKNSVFFCLPNIRDLKFFQENLSKGIEEFTFLFHGDLKKKEFIKNYNNLASTDHPKAIFGTPSFLFLAAIFKDINQIILEKENSSAYRTLSRPFIDERHLAEAIADENKIKMILADRFLRVETLHRIDQGEITEFIPLSFRLQNSIRKEIVDLKKEWSQGFKVLSEPLKEIITQVQSSKKRIFLFTLRKGLSGITACNDCGNILSCENCSAPMALYNTENKGRVFICNKCKSRKGAETKCENCASWNMIPLGIGTELVEQELTENFKKIKMFRIDKETTKTPAQAEKVAREFYKTPGAVLVGTEMALFYLKEKIDFAAVVSFDSLFSLPSFSLNEKIVQLVSALEEIASSRVIIQSKNPDESILLAIMGGNLSEFYRQELADRKKLFYPPFSTIIKITCQDSKESIEKIKRRLLESFNEYSPSFVLGFIPKVKNLYVLNIIIKVERSKWVDEKLLSRLLALPSDFTIRIEPEDLL